MNAVKITGLTLVDNPKSTRAGFTILAYFTVIANGIRIDGCSLVKTPPGSLTLWTPRIEVDTRRSIDIVDDRLHHEIRMRARDAYRALGGTELETLGGSGVIPSYDQIIGRRLEEVH